MPTKRNKKTRIKDRIKRNFWPALSIVMIFSFINISTYIIVALKTNFSGFSTAIIFNLFLLPAIVLFCDRLGLNEYLWKFWLSIPNFIHKTICLVIAIVGGALIIKALMPAMKKDYEKN